MPSALFCYLPSASSGYEASRERTTRASVVVPAHNASATIERCLRALIHQTGQNETYQIIVVDDGSTDDTATKAASIDGVRVIRSGHHGAAAARNCGARSASGDILLFTDADCEPATNWVQEMLAPFAEPAVMGAKGVYRTHQREPLARFVQCEYEEKYARMAGARSIDFVDTYGAAYRREVFLNSGGFDESFPAASVEDQEFSFRLTEQGARLVFAPSAIVYHQHVATLIGYSRRKFRIGYWKVRVHRRHPGKAWRDSHTPPTEKLQVLLVPVIIAALGAAPFLPMMGLLAALLAAIFVGSSLPLVWSVARRDPAITAIAPGMILIRAVALALGLAVGLGAEIWRGLVLAGRGMGKGRRKRTA